MTIDSKRNSNRIISLVTYLSVYKQKKKSIFSTKIYFLQAPNAGIRRHVPSTILWKFCFYYVVHLHGFWATIRTISRSVFGNILFYTIVYVFRYYNIIIFVVKLKYYTKL